MSKIARNPAPPARPRARAKAAEKHKVSPIGVVIAAIVAAGLVIPVAAYFGWAISVVWGWFVVPLGAPPLTVWEAAGILALTKFLTQDQRDLPQVEDRTSKEKVERLLGILLGPLVLVAIGALYHALS